MRRECEVSSLATQANLAAYEMRELRAEIDRCQERYAAQLEKYIRRARAIVDQQRKIADRLRELTDEADHAT
jgi:peptidoglycan hydrolase CwlO-like protein